MHGAGGQVHRKRQKSQLHQIAGIYRDVYDPFNCTSSYPLTLIFTRPCIFHSFLGRLSQLEIKLVDPGIEAVPIVSGIKAAVLTNISPRRKLDSLQELCPAFLHCVELCPAGVWLAHFKHSLIALPPWQPQLHLNAS